jgi:hypothetical protein
MHCFTLVCRNPLITTKRPLWVVSGRPIVRRLTNCITRPPTCDVSLPKYLYREYHITECRILLHFNASLDQIRKLTLPFFSIVIQVFAFPLRWGRRSRSPESTSRRRLFEQSEFLSHLRVRARITSPVWTPIHPVWRRCSSVSYEEYAQSSRLARQASHHPNRGSYPCANPDSGWRWRHPGEPASEQGRRGRAQARMVLPPLGDCSKSFLARPHATKSPRRTVSTSRALSKENAARELFEQSPLPKQKEVVCRGETLHK